MKKKKIKSIRSSLEPLFLGSSSNHHTCYKCTYTGALDWIIPSHYQPKYTNHAHEPLLKDFFEVADQGSHGVIRWHSRDLYLANLLSPDRFIILASCRCLLWSEGCHLGLTARLIWQLHPKHLLGLPKFSLVLEARDDPPSSYSLSFYLPVSSPPFVFLFYQRCTSLSWRILLLASSFIQTIHTYCYCFFIFFSCLAFCSPVLLDDSISYFCPPPPREKPSFLSFTDPHSWLVPRSLTVLPARCSGMKPEVLTKQLSFLISQQGRCLSPLLNTHHHHHHQECPSHFSWRVLVLPDPTKNTILSTVLQWLLWLSTTVITVLLTVDHPDSGLVQCTEGRLDSNVSSDLCNVFQLVFPYVSVSYNFLLQVENIYIFIC